MKPERQVHKARPVPPVRKEIKVIPARPAHKARRAPRERKVLLA